MAGERLSFSSGLHQQKVVSMNEEKEPLWFVWEKVTRGGFICNTQPSIYRGMPTTGTGDEKDRLRFVFKHQVLPSEQGWNLNQFIAAYPKPEVVDEEAKSRNTTKHTDKNTAADGLAREDSSDFD